jgi:hypothetical protein
MERHGLRKPGEGEEGGEDEAADDAEEAGADRAAGDAGAAGLGERGAQALPKAPVPPAHERRAGG